MPARTNSALGENICTAGGIVVLGVLLMGCQANSAALMYAQETHAQEVSSWCHAYRLGPTPLLQQDCVERAWVGVPHRECFSHPCTEQTYVYGPHYDARR